MVDKEVLRHFVIAVQHLDNAKFAGSPRHAIAEGYSAVDACFSALLVEAGHIPPHNHKNKFDSVMRLHPDLLDSYQESIPQGGTHFVQGIPWKEIETLYEEWLAARYEEFSAGPVEAKIRVGQANGVVGFALRNVGKKHTLTRSELEDKVRTLAFGYVFSKTDITTGDLAERRCEDAEQYGEVRGFPLGARLAETSNYCSVAITANDGLTQRIVETDTLIAEECSDVYERFIKLVEHVQAQRRIALTRTGPRDPDSSEPDETPDFMLSLKMSFHGLKISDLAKWLSRSTRTPGDAEYDRGGWKP
ncbi:MAG: hypothetical protein WCF26_00565 [Candidatus Sulfotelmatobacter sp.]